MLPPAHLPALSQRSLVLNRSWAAITTTSVRHALGLLYKGTARAIGPGSFELHGFESWLSIEVSPHDPCVRMVSGAIRVPEVVVLVSFAGMPRRSVAFSRRNLLLRDNGTCQYCGGHPHARELSVDHVIPRSRGGENSWKNCVLACERCNRRKGDRMPEQAGLELRRVPMEPRWSPVLEATRGAVRESWHPYINGGRT